MTHMLLLLAKARAYPEYVPAPPGTPATVASINSPTVTEGATVVFTVTLSGAAAIVSHLSYAVAGTAAPDDIGTPVFSAGVTLSGATLSVPAGVASFTVSIPTIDDIGVEPNETVVLTIGGITGIGTINNNDVAPTVTVEARAALAEPSDWIQDAHNGIIGGGRSQLVPLLPYNGNSVGFKRPWFHWPSPAEANSSADDATVYTLRIYASGGVTPIQSVSSEAGYNYARATSDLTPGTSYEWDVLHPVSGASGKRAFRVLPDAIDYSPPTRTSAATVAAVKARPRFGLSAGKIAAYTSGSNVTSFTRLKVLFDGNGSGGGFAGAAMPAETPSSFTSMQEHGRILCCQHLWQITGEAKYKTEGLRRFRNLIGWTGTYVANYAWDDAFRLHVLSCAIAYDTWGADLTTGECTQYFNLLGTQLNALIAGVGTAPFFTTLTPWQSKYGRRMWHLALFAGHDQNHMLAACTAAISVVGDEARFTSGHTNLAANIQIFAQAAEVILANFEFKATDDGAYRGGAAYLYTQHIFAAGCDALATCFNVPFWQAPRRARMNTLNPLLHPYYSGYFHDFGDDGAGRVLQNRAYLAFRKKTAEMNALIASAGWAVDDGDYAIHAHLYRDESADPAAATPTQLAAWSLDAGIFASHSSWSNATRITLKARSDPAGSWNHSNLRNSCIALWASGVPLLFDGGRYDYFNSPHQQAFKGLAHKAGNCVSLDGRAGGQYAWQGNNGSRSTRGGFQRVGREEAGAFAWFTSDARLSYQMTGYLHTKAKRSVLHLRPNVFLVVDDHALSGTAKTFEVNFKTENRQTYTGLSIASNVITGTKTHNLPSGAGVQALISTPRTKPTSVNVASNVATWTSSGGHKLPLGSAVPIIITPITGYGWPAGLSGYFTANVSSSTVFTVTTSGIADGAVSIPSGNEPGCEMVLDLAAAVPSSSTFTATATGATLSNQTYTGTVYVMFGPSAASVGGPITIGNNGVTATIKPLTGTGLSTPSAQLLTDSTWGGSNNTTLLGGLANANSHPLGTAQHFQSATQQQHHNYVQYPAATTLLAAQLIEVAGHTAVTGMTASADASAVSFAFSLGATAYTVALNRSTGEWTVTV